MERIVITSCNVLGTMVYHSPREEFWNTKTEEYWCKAVVILSGVYKAEGIQLEVAPWEPPKQQQVRKDQAKAAVR